MNGEKKKETRERKRTTKIEKKLKKSVQLEEARNQIQYNGPCNRMKSTINTMDHGKIKLK